MSRPRLRPARPLSYDKVLLAVYILSRDGIATRATCAEVARQAGVSVSTASLRLNDLHIDKVINIRGKGRICRRLFLLLDHPQAVQMLADLRESQRCRGPEDQKELMRQAKEWDKEMKLERQKQKQGQES